MDCIENFEPNYRNDRLLGIDYVGEEGRLGFAEELNHQKICLFNYFLFH